MMKKFIVKNHKTILFISSLVLLWLASFWIIKRWFPVSHFVRIELPKQPTFNDFYRQYPRQNKPMATYFKLANPWIPVSADVSLLQTEVTIETYVQFLNYTNDINTQLVSEPTHLQLPNEDQLILMGIHQTMEGDYVLDNPDNKNHPIANLNWLQADFFCKNICYTCQLPSEQEFEQAGNIASCDLSLPNEYCKMSVYLDKQLKELANFSIRDENVLIKKTEKIIIPKKKKPHVDEDENEDDGEEDIEEEDTEEADDTVDEDSEDLPEDEGEEESTFAYQTLIMNETEWINYTVSVASYPPNAKGFYDLSGNVAEWTRNEDNFQPINRISKGGSWYQSSKNVYLESRLIYSPYAYHPYLGFRCSRTSTITERKGNIKKF